ncbi:MAG: hypothetical protein ACLQBJ_18460 [Bryobacteraceae bacterium]
MRVQVTTQGHPVPLETTRTPYGYFSDCSIQLGFRAAPGSELLLIVSKPSQQETPRGKLIVLGDWDNVKDKAVSCMLVEGLQRIAKATAIFGLAFLAFAALFQRRRVLLRRGASGA